MVYRQPTIQPSRQKLELIRDRLHLLAGKDKAILAAYLEGQGVRQLALLANLSTSGLRRKLRRLITRLSSTPAEDYLLTLRNRCKFSSVELYIARDRLILGLSVRQIARKRKLTYYRSYRTVCKIERRIKKCKLTQSHRKLNRQQTCLSAKKQLVRAGCLG